MEHLVALVGFAFVSSVTPGPNNVLLWATGAQFGFRATVPHILGTALGIGAMAVAVAVGLGAIVTSVPGIVVVMKGAGSLYLIYLAILIVRSGAMERRTVAKPLSVAGAATFQLVNPKAWIFALGAITTFQLTDIPGFAGNLLIALVMAVVIVISASIWAGAGGVIGRLVEGERARRVVSLVLAAILLASVVTVWI